MKVSVPKWFLTHFTNPFTLELLNTNVLGIHNWANCWRTILYNFMTTMNFRFNSQFFAYHIPVNSVIEFFALLPSCIILESLLWPEKNFQLFYRLCFLVRRLFVTLRARFTPLIANRPLPWPGVSPQNQGPIDYHQERTIVSNRSIVCWGICYFPWLIYALDVVKINRLWFYAHEH